MIWNYKPNTNSIIYLRLPAYSQSHFDLKKATIDEDDSAISLFLLVPTILCWNLKYPNIKQCT